MIRLVTVLAQVDRCTGFSNVAIRLTKLGNKCETIGCVEPEEAELSDCFISFHGWNINQWQVAESALKIASTLAQVPHVGTSPKTELGWGTGR